MTLENGSAQKVYKREGNIVEGFGTVKEEDAPAYLANYSAHRKGISFEESVKEYNSWAKSYDTDVPIGRYNGPRIVADAVEEYYKFQSVEEREKLRILDVAAGTGKVGVELVKRGFGHFDGLEPSKGMMDILEGKNIYEKTFLTSIGHGQIQEIRTNTYDCLTVAGGMGEGHIPVVALNEMIRVVRQGGVIFIVMREEYLSYVSQYVGKLEPYMNSLGDAQLWKQIGRKVIKDYSFKKPGVIFVYEVTSDEVTASNDDDE